MRLVAQAVAGMLLCGPATLGAATQARFTRLSIEQGLSQNTVQSILQDRVGFLWFGTEEGLNRWDGYTFVAFKHDPRDPKSLPDNLVSVLFEDGQGQLWVGTATGLSAFDPATETFTRALSTHWRVTALLESGGRLWVGTEGEGLLERDPRTGEVVHHRNDPQDPNSLAGNAVSSLLEERGGGLWIGLRGRGLDRLEPGQKVFQHLRHDPSDPQSLGHDDVWGLTRDAGGDLWVATNNGGLSVRDHQTGRFRRYRHRAEDPQGLATDLLTCVLFDRAGMLWIGSEGRGLQRYDPARGRFEAFLHDPSNTATLGNDIVRTIYEDRAGQLWVGTFSGGVSVLRKPPHSFDYFTYDHRDPQSLSDPPVASLLEDRDGFVWVGTEGGGINRFDRRSGRLERFRFPSEVPGRPAILSLHQDTRGRIWAGTYRMGLARFDPARRAFVHHRHVADDPATLASDDVWVITAADDETLWLGTNAAVERFDPNTGTVRERFVLSDPSGHYGVRALHQDRQGNLWVGTMGGLHVRRRGERELVRYRHDPQQARSLSHDWVVALHEDAQGRMWAGTYGGGLNRFDAQAGDFTVYKQASGLPSDVVYAILEDGAGRLWLSTNRGLSRFDPASERFENFDHTHGLESLQFHMGAGLETRSGHLLFGSFNGFYYFDPAAIKADRHAAAVVLTAMRLLSRPLAPSTPISSVREVTLTPEDKVFSLEFAALDYAIPRRNHYAYRLQGAGDQWIQLGERREVTFSSLDPGRYVFQVKAATSDGVWSETDASLRIVVKPPFWRTWWFRVLIAAAVLLAFVTVLRLRVRRLEERERTLTGKVEEELRRVRILRGLLPMCAWCKKIRDDKGYWSQVETFIRQHSEADFSHGICPECVARVYPNVGSRKDPEEPQAP
jgi:ligand-binding sensor domain-containing protein